MDSLTQIVLGGAIAAAIVPPEHRRAALLAGAALGTLPDLDSLPLKLLTDDPVLHMTWHRSVSHSLFVLPMVAWLIWYACRRRGGRVAQSPARWWWAILLALTTHPVLDAFTVYGTQLWWPLPVRPSMWSSVFIIDPLYTVWLLLACVSAWLWTTSPKADRALQAALLISSVYLGWSLAAKYIVESRARASLVAMGLADAPLLSVPTPLNTLLWRVVAMTPQGYLESHHSLPADAGQFAWHRHGSDMQALRAAQTVSAVPRLEWFTHGFLKAHVAADGRLILTDLRMGSEPHYTFRFAVARRDADGRWIPLQPAVQLPWDIGSQADVAALWHRIWNAPVASSGMTRPSH